MLPDKSASVIFFRAVLLEAKVYKIGSLRVVEYRDIFCIDWI